MKIKALTNALFSDIQEVEEAGFLMTRVAYYPLHFNHLDATLDMVILKLI